MKVDQNYGTIVAAIGTFFMAAATVYLGSKANEIALKSYEIVKLTTDEPFIAVCPGETKGICDSTTFILKNSRKFKEYKTPNYRIVNHINSTVTIEDTGKVAALPIESFPSAVFKITIESPIAIREISILELDTTGWTVKSTITQGKKGSTMQVLKINIWEPIRTTEKMHIKMLWTCLKHCTVDIDSLNSNHDVTEYMRKHFRVEVWSPQSHHSYISIWP